MKARAQPLRFTEVHRVLSTCSGRLSCALSLRVLVFPCPGGGRTGDDKGEQAEARAGQAPAAESSGEVLA